MKQLLGQLRNRLGDFWWYSLMIFLACRVADALNMAVGLWLVPKYVDAAELGAVLPLSSFASFLALPAYVFAMTFMKEVNTLAVHGEFGRMKTLMRGVFTAVGAFLVLAIVVSRLVLPAFLERIRIVEGSLGLLIVASAFLNCVAPIFTNALQALKKFKAISVINILGAPIRFATMLAAMPYRALSGYFVGQSSTPVFSIVASLVALRKELSVKAEAYWSKPVVKRFTLLFLGMAGYQMFGMFAGTVEQTVLRQRIPDIESAAYYMTTRFSDISNYLALTLITVLFPFTAEKAERGESTRPLVVKSTIALFLFGALLAVFFWLFGRPIMQLLPNGDKYCGYSWAIPWQILLNVINASTTFHANTEASAFRFGFLKWWIPFHLAAPLLLLGVTGYGYFASALPSTWCDFLAANNFTSLEAMMWYFTVVLTIRFVIAAIELARQR